MPRKNKKRCPKIVNVTQKEKLIKLFDEASDESDVPDENYSDQELEESERSADEKDDSEHSSVVSIHDPYSDGDGEYGSDVDYVPEEEEILTDGSSDGAESESSQVSQSKSNSHKVAKASCQSKDQCSEKSMIQASSSPSSKVPKILTSDPSQQPGKGLMIQPMVSQNKQLVHSPSILSPTQHFQLATNTEVDQLPGTRASSLQTKPMPSPDQQASSTTIGCFSVIEVHSSSSKKTTIQEQPTPSQNLSVTAIQVDCSPVIQTSTLSLEQMQVQPNQSDLNTQKGCSSPNHISSTQKLPMQVQSNQRSADTPSDCNLVVEVQGSISQKTTSQEQPNQPSVSKPMDCSPVIQASQSSKNRLDTDKEIDCSPDTQICSLQQSEARSVQPVNQLECQSVAQSNSSQQRQPTPPANLENEPNPLDTDMEIDCSPQQREASSVQPVNQLECPSVAQSNSSQLRQPTPPANLENEPNPLDTDMEIDCSPQQREASSVQPVNQLECPSVAQSNSSQQRQPTPPANLENEQNLGRPISPNHVSSWEDNTLPITVFQFDDMNSGPTVPLDNNTTPMNVLEYFFTDEMVDFIVSCTNTYGTTLCNSNRPHTRGSRAKSFKPTDAEEMKKFLGLCILQGHLDVPSVRKLFTQSDPLYCYPIFPYTMSGRRFEQLLRCLCMSELNSKGIDKVKAFTEKVIRNFQTLNQPEKELSLDESLMPFRGRLSFRQYIKNKKAKYGIKFYVLTSHDGYILNFVIYEGKDTVNETNATEPKLDKLVMKLMEPYLNKGHDLYMDNFYNSVTLSKKLLEYNTHTTGTLRKDRKENPKELFQKQLKSGQHLWQRNAKVYASVWKDKRPVFMITTKHDPRLVTTRNRFGKLKTKPVEVNDYNRHMSGIDKSDQMMSYYSTPKKTIRWYKKVFFRLLDMIIWNAFYLFRKHCDPTATLLGFRETIVNSYIQVNENTKDAMLKNMLGKKHANRRQRGVVGDVGEISPQNGHWPELIPLRDSSKRNKVFLKCRVCTKNKKLKQTSYRCKGCVGNPPLCPGCFESWHTNPIFRM